MRKIGFPIKLPLIAFLVIATAAISLPARAQSKSVQSGIASFYSISTNGGTVTASGEPLNDHANTAAHRTLPFGTKVKVTNVRNGKSEVVRITDRGPYIQDRIIDVTRGVAKKLGFISAGLTPVKIEVTNRKSPVKNRASGRPKLFSSPDKRSARRDRR